MSTFPKVSVNDWLTLHSEPKSIAHRSSQEEVLQLLTSSPESIVILDLRNDRAPGYLKESVSIPATTLTGYLNLKTQVIDPLLKAKPSVKTIVVHCNSSKNRATKVAGWIQDYITENQINDLKVTVLNEGINGWLKLGNPYDKFVIATSD